MSLDLSPARLLAALVALAAGAIILWQAGVLFQDKDAGASVDGLRLEPAVIVETPGGQPGLREGDLAPDFEFSAFDGRRLRLSDLRGGAVVLNFWATWCAPCRRELPDLEDALRRYQDTGLSIVAMNAGESPARATSWLDDVGVELTAFGYDPEQRIIDLYNIEGLPVTYFINAEGRITRVVTGQVTPGIATSAIEEATGLNRRP